ncbi:MAG: aminoacetone oxidase family FAD-binding enzyme, partial [Candidatus Coatesbacteria bacterium]|nr:aminoacetone oxidase family FAD-binding enzyme [Candidatus Coatesbacteria bacterium]
MTKPYDVIIIGGGAAGLTTGIVAARRNARTLILERKELPGRKILVTGNGRCNLTNSAADEVERYRGAEPRFARNALSAFNVASTLAFFEELGIALVERDGRWFPRSMAAADVLEALLEGCREAGAELLGLARVAGLEPGAPWTVHGAGGRSWRAWRVVLATGGCSAPKTGSDGDGFRLARELGHRVFEPRPALVGLECRGNLDHFLQGVKLDARARCVAAGLELGPDEVLFAHYGITGPLALDLSLELGRELAAGPVELELDLLPELDADELPGLLQRRADDHPRRELGNLLLGLLPRRVPPVLLRRLELDPTINCAAMRAGVRNRLAATLKALPLTLSAPRGWEEAAATLGGVDTGEVDPRRLESRLRLGLHFAGEVLDICGECGGFNLQWA